MVALRGGEIIDVSLDEALSSCKSVPPDGQMVRMARNIGVCFGDDPIVDNGK